MKTAQPNVPRLALSRSELAISIGVSPTSIDVMVEEGVLPPPRQWHTRKLWIVQEVQAALMEWPEAGEGAAKESYFDGASVGPIQAKPQRNVEPPLEVSLGKGGYPIADGPKDPLQQYYDKLGFDPLTMGEADMKRLTEEAHARWIASIPGSKITKRELNALEILVAAGVDVPVLETAVKGMGDDTRVRLEARGFITSAETFSPEKVSQGFSRREVRLQQSGLNAWDQSKKR